MPNPKKILKVIEAGKKAARRRQTDKIQKNSVKVKPAAKQKPNKPNQAKLDYKNRTSYNKAYNKSIKKYYSMSEPGRFSSVAERKANAELETIDAMGKLGLSRKANIAQKKINQTNKRKATTPKNESTADPFANRIKINSSIPKRRGK